MELINNTFSAKDAIKKLLALGKRGFEELTRLDKEELEQYKKKLYDLEELNKKRENYTTKEIGDALEDIVNFIIEKSSIFKVIPNRRTSTNEIDHLIVFNEDGKFYKEFIDIKGDYFIGECKNYDDKIGVTWVGKFYSLISCSSCRMGVLFSYNGLKGKGWNSAKGLTKKLFLMKEKLEERIYIIDFNIAHFKKIVQGENFLSILEDEMIKLSTDTNFSNEISEHPNESAIKEIVEEYVEQLPE